MIDKRKRGELRAALKDPVGYIVVGWVEEQDEAVTMEPDDLLELLDRDERLEAVVALLDKLEPLHPAGYLQAIRGAIEEEPGNDADNG